MNNENAYFTVSRFRSHAISSEAICLRFEYNLEIWLDRPLLIESTEIIFLGIENMDCEEMSFFWIAEGQDSDSLSHREIARFLMTQEILEVYPIVSNMSSTGH